MTQRRADLQKLRVWKAAQARDEAGGVYSQFPEPSAEFWGSLQPYDNTSLPREFGVDLLNSYIVITADRVDARPLDRIGVFGGGAEYEVKTVQQWPSYLRMICEKR